MRAATFLRAPFTTGSGRDADLGLGGHAESTLFEGTHPGAVTARALGEEQHRGTLPQQLLALAQAGYLAAAVEALQRDVS